MELTHPSGENLIEKGVIGAAHSMKTGLISAVYQTMEEMFIKFAEG